MPTMILLPTSLAQWHALVNEAEVNCRLELGESVESYLVFLLMRFSKKVSWAKSVVALDFLQAFKLSGSQRENVLQDVGDRCLLITGLFPEQIKRRRLNQNYYIEVGQSAYGMLADHDFNEISSDNLYQRLSHRFTAMCDVLQSIRVHQ